MSLVNDVFDNALNEDFELFKELFFKILVQNTHNEKIKKIIKKLHHECTLDSMHNREEFSEKNVENTVDFSKYLEVEIYNISGKEYYIDTKNGIVFSGKRADIVEILSKDVLEKLKSNKKI